MLQHVVPHQVAALVKAQLTADLGSLHDATLQYQIRAWCFSQVFSGRFYVPEFTAFLDAQLTATLDPHSLALCHDCLLVARDSIECVRNVHGRQFVTRGKSLRRALR